MFYTHKTELINQNSHIKSIAKLTNTLKPVHYEYRRNPRKLHCITD
jgi:hypothetical protein